MDLFFFVFSAISVIASFFVVFSSNPVHSVLSLIIVFCGSSAVMLSLTVDFLSILFIVVYVGAIAVLFLFVIMMLNIRVAQLSESSSRWVPLVILVFLGLAAELFYIFDIFKKSFNAHYYPDYMLFEMNENLVILSSVLYNYYCYEFLLASFVLLTALIGAITLTLGVWRLSRRQLVYKQLGRNYFNSVHFYE